MKRVRGFTLLEVMLVVAIVGILAAIALPAYQNQVRKGNRSAAQQFMLDVATKEQQILMDSRRYVAVTDTSYFGNKPSDANAGIGIAPPDSTVGKYTFVVTADNTATPPTFLITATAASGQAVDAASAQITIDQAGTRNYRDSSGTVTSTW
ncbi:MAG TPA: type IV pilin protein [Casimicrobiaceae bacterium]|nr:type IV pilin protein [Casimicrobiaceae bacterium]